MRKLPHSRDARHRTNGAYFLQFSDLERRRRIYQLGRSGLPFIYIHLLTGVSMHDLVKLEVAFHAMWEAIGATFDEAMADFQQKKAKDAELLAMPAGGNA
jgi:hypothetical protein